MKREKMMVCLLFLLLCLSSGIMAATSYPPYTRGDSNGDKKITVTDALIAAQYYVGIIEDIELWAADTNCDGKVNIVDALLIAQYYVGIIDTFPCPPPPAGNDYVRGNVIIAFIDDVTLEEANLLIDSYNLVWENHFPLSSSIAGFHWGVVDVPYNDELKWINIFTAEAIVKYAELNGIATIDTGF